VANFHPGQIQPEQESGSSGFYTSRKQGSDRPRAGNTMPTALKRQGRLFTATSVQIKDPSTGQNLPGNKVPLSSLNPNGRALLKHAAAAQLHQPGNHGRQLQFTRSRKFSTIPKRSQLFKIRLGPNSKDRFFVPEDLAGPSRTDTRGRAGEADRFLRAVLLLHRNPGLESSAGRHLHPTIVMEATAGIRHNHEAWHPESGELDKVPELRKSGFNAGQWYPQANPQGIIPRFSFGSAITNPPDGDFSTNRS